MNLYEKAKDHLEKSMVTDLETGKSIESEYRTSSGTFLNKAQVHELYIPLFYAAISFQLFC